MELQNFVQKVAEQFLEEDQSKVKASVVFRKLSSWDSLTGMAVLTMIEDDYGVVISVEDFKSVNTAEELFDLVKSKVE